MFHTRITTNHHRNGGGGGFAPLLAPPSGRNTPVLLFDLEAQDIPHPAFGVVQHVGAAVSGGGGGGGGGGGTDTHGDGKDTEKKRSGLAAVAPSSVGDILARVYNLVISFFTNAYIQVVMGPDPSPDVFFIYFAVMVIVLMFYDTARAIIVRMGGRDRKWNATLVSVLDFATITLVLIVFQTAPVLALQYWTRAGMSVPETIVLPVLAIVAVFAAYHYIANVAKKET